MLEKGGTEYTTRVDRNGTFTTRIDTDGCAHENITPVRAQESEK